MNKVSIRFCLTFLMGIRLMAAEVQLLAVLAYARFADGVFVGSEEVAARGGTRPQAASERGWYAGPHNCANDHVRYMIIGGFSLSDIDK